ncbi:T6SS immunity protein Tli4 family protein [Pseudoduganella violaceinigra]|uniref:T6SS immunity protein Tli4 family protein n=1 Tax=Pseudoduganella violaceinigra TaxID=246602 RepID=UPI0012B65537|nr:T6SS immunity protein Tli4 family protein [Pseudoduganella violaceinigra]
MDVPSQVILGATPLKFDSAFQIEGIGGGDFWGELRYGGLNILESYPSDNAGFKQLKNEVNGKVSTPEEYRLSISSHREEVAHWRERVRKEPHSEFQKGILKDEEAALNELIAGARVSGVAKLNDSKSFAIRSEKSFIGGFRDDLDKRVRVFDGPLTTLEPGSPKAAENELQRIRRQYVTRPPNSIPHSPGFCTGFGFINEPAGPQSRFTVRIPFQLKQQPNLLFYVAITPAENIDPKDRIKLPRTSAVYAMTNQTGMTHRHGPHAVKILGMPGQMTAHEYGPICSTSTDCVPAEQAYDMEAEVLGEEGRADRPHLVLHMSAVLSDEYKSKLAPVSGNDNSNKPDHPALRGQVPPPYKVGREIFEQVLQSIRIRPGAFANKANGPAGDDGGKAN